jgi:glycosyltransferase involved in cell wall biosynthesis
MKILFVSSGTSTKGISPIVKKQGESLSLQNIDLHYFLISQPGLKGYVKAIIYLRKYLHKNKFDIIHAHYGLSGLVALLAKRKEKLLVSFMGDDLIGSHAFDGAFTLFGKILKILNIILTNVVYDHAIVKSNQMLMKLEHAKTTLVPNGVDLSLFKPMDKSAAMNLLQLNQNEKIILFASNPSRSEKNYTLCKQAVEFINLRNIRLLTISEVSQEELVLYYNAADVLVLSSFHEGSPNVIKEAMACNCPIVSTDVGDVKWLIGNTEGCFLSSFDTKDFAAKINDALNYGKRCGRTTGRARILELSLDSESVAKIIIDIYKKLLN